MDCDLITRRNAVATAARFPMVMLEWLGWSIGAWLSLVEHLVRDQGVGGSNPLAPTNTFQIAHTRRPLPCDVFARMPGIIVLDSTVPRPKD